MNMLLLLGESPPLHVRLDTILGVTFFRLHVHDLCSSATQAAHESTTDYKCYRSMVQ